MARIAEPRSTDSTARTNKTIKLSLDLATYNLQKIFSVSCRCTMYDDNVILTYLL